MQSLFKMAFFDEQTQQTHTRTSSGAFKVLPMRILHKRIQAAGAPEKAYAGAPPQIEAPLPSLFISVCREI
jgi:hypothetical protein